MSLVRQIEVRTITPQRANLFVKRHHYSGKVVPNSQVHFGAFLAGELHGVLQFGPSMDKRKTQTLVSGTGWNEFIELNRMAFDETLPKNSESRVIGICLRILKKKAPHLKWVVSFADATQCGDGTIYRASGFILTGITKNTATVELPDGSIVSRMTYTKGKHLAETNGRAGLPGGARMLPGFQMRYLFFLDKSVEPNLAVQRIPFHQIAMVGASMYKGKRVEHENNAAGFHPAESGAVPTSAHQDQHATTPIEPTPTIT